MKIEKEIFIIKAYQYDIRLNNDIIIKTGKEKRRKRRKEQRRKNNR